MGIFGAMMSGILSGFQPASQGYSTQSEQSYSREHNRLVTFDYSDPGSNGKWIAAGGSGSTDPMSVNQAIQRIHGGVEGRRVRATINGSVVDTFQ